MYILKAQLKSVSPLSQSRMHCVDKLERETPEAYDTRTWREKCHFTQDGYVMINPMAFKFALTAAAKYLGEKIAGRGQSTWTKRIEAGLFIDEQGTIVLPLKREDLKCITILANADGVRGSGKRVPRKLPQIQDWSGELTINVMEEKIPPDLLARYLKEAGIKIGIGQFRPEKGGYCGRFTVNGYKVFDLEGHELNDDLTPKKSKK